MKSARALALIAVGCVAVACVPDQHVGTLTSAGVAIITCLAGIGGTWLKFRTDLAMQTELHGSTLALQESAAKLAIADVMLEQTRSLLEQARKTEAALQQAMQQLRTENDNLRKRLSELERIVAGI